MAHIDDLVKKVADPQLRAALADQIRTLTDRTEFGLTFQRHLPESVQLPEQRIRRGDHVELRDDAKGGSRYRVVSAKADDEAVVVIEVDSADEPVGEQVGKLRSDLVVVKLFGEPIYPGLRQVGEAGSAAPGQPTHVVVAGENFHALQALEYTHEGKVDLIYIDPPYNTGAADWKYNDRYVDNSDSYRHSKWLSFMERRLKLSKSLLKETGFIVLAIDDNEHHRLRMLADQVFGEGNFIANISWQGNTKNDTKFTGEGLDYMIVYAKSRETVLASGRVWREEKPGVEEMFAAAAEAWENSGGDSKTATAAYRKWLYGLDRGNPILKNKHYNFVDDARPGEPFFSSPIISPNYRPNLCYEILHPVTGLPVTTPKNGWSLSEPTFWDYYNKGAIRFGEDETNLPTKKVYLRDVSMQNAVPSFREDRRSAGKHLEQILGDKRFPFPKNHDVLMRWFGMMAPKDAVILDFFAGSGSTAEAVIKLNEQDGGTRQCILVTNNELSKKEDALLRKKGLRPGDDEYEALGVFHHVTKPRVSTVLTGVREDGSRFSDGVDGQAAAFFDLTYEDENLVALGRRFEAVAPLLWLKAGAVGAMIDKIDESGFSAPEDANYAVIFNTDANARATEALHDGVELVYVVTDSDADFRRTVAALPRRLQPTAQRLYSSYLRSFEINRG